jgi:hypothetical protein
MVLIALLLRYPNNRFSLGEFAYRWFQGDPDE